LGDILYPQFAERIYGYPWILSMLPQSTRDMTLKNCLDLMQIYKDQDPRFFVKHSVKVGAARRFVRDIGLWVKRAEKSLSTTIVVIQSRYVTMNREQATPAYCVYLSAWLRNVLSYHRFTSIRETRDIQVLHMNGCADKLTRSLYTQVGIRVIASVVLPSFASD
jgi:hypothetical protein